MNVGYPKHGKVIGRVNTRFFGKSDTENYIMPPDVFKVH